MFKKRQLKNYLATLIKKEFMYITWFFEPTLTSYVSKYVKIIWFDKKFLVFFFNFI